MKLLNRVQELLRQADVSSEIQGDDLFVQARCETLGFRLRVTESDSALTVCAHLGLFCPVYRRHAMYEAMSRANWLLKFGRVEMDSEDGELRLRGDMPLFGTEPSDQQVKRLVSSVWSSVETYAPALLQIITTDVAPAVAIERVEGIAETMAEVRPDAAIN